MQAIDSETARRKMVEQQIRPWAVVDERVLDVMGRTPREDYVPVEYRDLAYADMDIPLAHGQTMMAPKLEARLLQALNVGARDKVLEIGTGSGYVTAALAALGSHVYSVEIVSELAEEARRKLKAHGVENATIEVGDAARGWPRHAPYDAIFVGGSLPLAPTAFREQLAPRGRMVAIVGRAPTMEALLIERLDERNWRETSLLETVVAPLVNAPEPAKFVF